VKGTVNCLVPADKIYHFCLGTALQRNEGDRCDRWLGGRLNRAPVSPRRVRRPLPACPTRLVGAPHCALITRSGIERSAFSEARTEEFSPCRVGASPVRRSSHHEGRQRVNRSKFALRDRSVALGLDQRACACRLAVAANAAPPEPVSDQVAFFPAVLYRLSVILLFYTWRRVGRLCSPCRHLLLPGYATSF